MFELRKSFKFEAAHQLVYHDGKCRNLHGHSYQLTVELRAASLIGAGPKRNMVQDFTDISRPVKKLITSHLDHHHLNDTLQCDSPTAEYIAQWVYLRLAPELPNLVAVTVHETATSSATYRHVPHCTCGSGAPPSAHATLQQHAAYPNGAPHANGVVHPLPNGAARARRRSGAARPFSNGRCHRGGCGQNDNAACGDMSDTAYPSQRPTDVVHGASDTAANGGVNGVAYPFERPMNLVQGASTAAPNGTDERSVHNEGR